MRNCFGTFISASARLVALPDRQLKFFSSGNAPIFTTTGCAGLCVRFTCRA
jgi:hypothetical protein